VDGNGKPIEGAYVAHWFWGHTFRVVESGRYYRAGSMRRTNAEGKIRFPLDLHVHFPLFYSRPYRAVPIVYAPRLHAYGRFDEVPWRNRPPYEKNLPGFEVDNEKQIIKLYDATDDRELWAKNIMGIMTWIHVGCHNIFDWTSDTVKRAFIEDLQRECNQFAMKHGHTKRAILPRPPEWQYWKDEYRKWLKKLYADLGQDHLGEAIINTCLRISDLEQKLIKSSK